MADLLSWATEHYQFVVIDTPPVAVVSTISGRRGHSTGVPTIIVSQLGKNTRDAAAYLRDRLRGVNAPLLGVVANGVKAKSETAYGYGYNYGYAHAYGDRLTDQQLDETQQPSAR